MNQSSEEENKVEDEDDDENDGPDGEAAVFGVVDGGCSSAGSFGFGIGVFA